MEAGNQNVSGQKIFITSGTSATGLVAYSTSGATALIVNQDTNFTNPALVISRSGTIGSTSSSPTFLVLASNETQWNNPVFSVGGCLAWTGDNYVTMWGNGGISIPGGIYDDLGGGLILSGSLAIDVRSRNLVRKDGSILEWNTTSGSNSIITQSLGDVRYAPTTTTLQLINSGSYTLQNTDNGKILRFSLTTTVYIPTGLSIGFNVTIIQEGSGQVTLVPNIGATMHNRQGYTKTAGQWAVVSIICTDSNIYVLKGDTFN